jgi:hypothetical protein
MLTIGKGYNVSSAVAFWNLDTTLLGNGLCINGFEMARLALWELHSFDYGSTTWHYVLCKAEYFMISTPDFVW